MIEAASTPGTWPPLAPLARRVLGVLIEKAKTTPDNYPLSLNALVAGCNQKNNRDPVMNLVDVEVDEAMARLKQLGYAQQILGSGRVDKFRHVLYEAWRVGKEELAILGELLLRGPQTEGELRGRASRMEPLPDLETLRSHLQHLSARGLIVFLGPAGRRGTLITHGFHLPEELSQLARGAETLAAAPPAPPHSAARSAHDPAIAERIDRLEADVRDLREAMARLTDKLERLSG